MRLKYFYAKKEDIPEGFDSLYTERDGKWVLTGVEGIRPQADLDKVQTALTEEREEHKRTKDALALFGDKKPEDVAAAYEELEVLREKAAGGGDDKVEALVAKRVEQELGPIRRENARLKSDAERLQGDLEQANQAIVAHESREKGRKIQDTMRHACAEAGITEESKVEDVLLYSERLFELTEDDRVVTRDNAGVMPGISPVAWLQDVNDGGKKNYWWPEPSGGGGTGNDGKGQVKNNPWKKDTFNLTEQGRITRENPDLAKKLKAQAG